MRLLLTDNCGPPLDIFEELDDTELPESLGAEGGREQFRIAHRQAVTVVEVTRSELKLQGRVGGPFEVTTE